MEQLKEGVSKLKCPPSPTFFVGMGEMLTFAETNEKNGQR